MNRRHLALSLTLLLAMLHTLGMGASLRLNGVTIDPAKSSAKALGELKANDAGRVMALLQFSGPIQSQWRSELERSGVEFHYYVPDFGYLVTMPEVSSKSLGQAKAVAWVGAMPETMKIEPQLAAKLAKTAKDTHAASAPEKQLKVTILGLDYEAVNTLDSLGVKVEKVVDAPTGWIKTQATVPVSAIKELSETWGVFHIEQQLEYKTNGERGAQIAAGNFSMVTGKPDGPGYQAWLSGYGLTGGTLSNNSPLVIQVQDDGVDRGDQAIGSPDKRHPDLADRLIGNFNATSDTYADGAGGHGTINAGIIAGNPTIGMTDSAGYELGLGVVPQAEIYNTKIFSNAGPFEIGSNTYADMSTAAYQAGARISSNSWGASTFGGYSADCAEFDALVRDADPATPGNQQMIYIFAAGNDGYNPQTLGSPGSSKNVITVGAGENTDEDGDDGCGIGPNGSDDARDLIHFSSRGPAADGRLGVDLFAVGTHVQGMASQSDDYNGKGVCDMYWPEGQTWYARSSGTSHSTPMTAGASALIYEFFDRVLSDPSRGHTATPSPALMRAVLTNTATDMAGGNDGAGGTLGHVPNTDQGWGSLNMSTLFDMADSLYTFDQQHLFQTSGEEWETIVTVDDPSKPLKISLAWTDAPALPGANPALNNDLDLFVTSQGQTWRGNVFANGYSTTGGASDRLNNLESVYLELPAGEYTIRVYANNIAADGVPGNGTPTDQDFALFVWNGKDQSPKGVVNIINSAVNCAGSLDVIVSDEDLRNDPGPVSVDVLSTTGDSESILLSESPVGSGVWRGTIATNTAAVANDSVVQVTAGGTITVTYNDADDGSGSPAVVNDDVNVDCTPAVISNVSIDAFNSQQARITLDTDELANVRASYGPSCLSSDQWTSTTASADSHALLISGLTPETTYYVKLEAVDQAGNIAVDDNTGNCYSFTTPEYVDYFTEQFSANDNDLSYQMFTFTPDASVHGYTVCREYANAFPNDISGATKISGFSDYSALLALGGGETVELYGVEYDQIYINSNGNLTFEDPDFTYTESIGAHFAQPRVAALYDDLSPQYNGHYVEQLADRVAVTWVNIFEWYPDTDHLNSFQIEMFFDGRIRITYLRIDALDGIMGLSRGGGVPGDFFESDMTSYGDCGGAPATSPPFIKKIDDVTVIRGEALPTVLDVALVGDYHDDDGTLAVAVSGQPAGLTINLTNTDGKVEASILADGGLATDRYELVLTVTDSNIETDTIDWQVTVRDSDPIDYFTEQFISGLNNFDMDDSVLTLTPEVGIDFYSACTYPIDEVPTYQDSATQVELPDDGFVEIALTDNKKIPFYTKSYESFFISSNGYITFERGDGNYLMTEYDYFATPRVSMLITDLDPSAGGSVWVDQLETHVAITWWKVPSYGSNYSATGQIELFFDGTIRISWGAVGPPSGFAGLSEGIGRPDDFEPQDLSAYIGCADGVSQTPPYILMRDATGCNSPGYGKSETAPKAMIIEADGGLTKGQIIADIEDAESTIENLSLTVENAPAWLDYNIINIVNSQEYLSATLHADASAPRGTHWIDLTVTDEDGLQTHSRMQVHVVDPDGGEYGAEYFGFGDFNVANNSIVFLPTPTGPNFYRPIRQENVTEFYEDPTEHQEIVFENDGIEQALLHLNPGHKVRLFGEQYTDVYINMNGYVSLGEPSLVSNHSVYGWDDHFATPKVVGAIIPAWPTAVEGRISFREYNYKLVVTYEDLVKWGDAGSPNSFQLEMYYDGTIRLTYLDFAYAPAYVGLSAGEGMPVDFGYVPLYNCTEGYQFYDGVARNRFMGYPLEAWEGEIGQNSAQRWSLFE